MRPVRNEGKCTGSYAFSAIGAIEGNAFVYHQISKDYSVQQLIDCSNTYGNQGCNTGYMTNCFEYIRSKGTFVLIKASVLRMSIPLEKIMDLVDTISEALKSVDSQILYLVTRWNQL